MSGSDNRRCGGRIGWGKDAVSLRRQLSDLKKGASSDRVIASLFVLFGVEMTRLNRISVFCCRRMIFCLSSAWKDVFKTIGRCSMRPCVGEDNGSAAIFVCQLGNRAFVIIPSNRFSPLLPSVDPREQMFLLPQNLCRDWMTRLASSHETQTRAAALVPSNNFFLPRCGFDSDSIDSEWKFMISCRKLASIQLHISHCALLANRGSFFQLFFRWKSLKEICLIQSAVDFKFMTSRKMHFSHLSNSTNTTSGLSCTAFEFLNYNLLLQTGPLLPALRSRSSTVREHHKSRISNTMQNTENSKAQQTIFPTCDRRRRRRRRRDFRNQRI